MSTRSQAQIKAAPTPSFAPTRSGLLQRKCACGGTPGLTGECEKCRKKRLTLQRRSDDRAEPSTVPPIVREVLRSPGQPLDAATRAFMEPRFGHDFSQVQVHTDARAAESARAVNALAYTVGHNVVFGANEYAPKTHHGRGLLAHELAHTIQQRSASGAPPSMDRHGIFESSAEGAGRAIANGQAVSRDLPACGVGLARAPVPPEDFDDQELARQLQQVAERLKQPAYEGREWDLDWYQRLKAVADGRAKARNPVPPAPPVPVAPPKAPPEDPARGRAAAVAEAQAVIARTDEAPNDDDDEEYVTPMDLSPAARPYVRRKKAPPAPPSRFSPGGFTDDDIYKEYKEATKRIDEQISREREISKEPYKDRLHLARLRAQAESDYWYSAKEANARMTGEDVWNTGRRHGLFLESEKKSVYEDQGSIQKYYQEKIQEAVEQSRRNFETDQYNRHVARGKQLSSPAPILQGFAFGGFGRLAVAAYAGTQSGAMVGQAINACAGGTTAECAAATVQAGGAVAVSGLVHHATRVKPVAPAVTTQNPQIPTIPRGTDVPHRSQFVAPPPLSRPVAGFGRDIEPPPTATVTSQKRPIGFQPPTATPPTSSPTTAVTPPLSRPVAGFGRDIEPPPGTATQGPPVVTQMPPAQVMPLSPNRQGIIGQRRDQPAKAMADKPPGGDKPEVRPAGGQTTPRPRDTPEQGRVERDVSDPRRYVVKEHFGETGAAGQPQPRYHVDVKLNDKGIMEGDFVLRGERAGVSYRSGSLRGKDEFMKAKAHFEKQNGPGSVKGIKSDWGDGDNLQIFNEKFNAAKAQGLPDDVAMRQAASKTHTGQWADEAGFRKITVGDSTRDSSGKFIQVEVVFER